MNIKIFLEKFNIEYDFLYNASGYVAGYNEAVTAFDEFAKENQKFISEFCRYRGDFISGDREAAAFMFALSDF